MEIDVPSISERDFMRIQKRAAIMQAASEKNKVDPLLQEATKAQVDAALEHLVPGRDHHYFATAKEREQFEQKWEEWSAGDEDARDPEPVPVLQTFRYYASAEEEDEQEEAARLLRGTPLPLGRHSSTNKGSDHRQRRVSRPKLLGGRAVGVWSSLAGGGKASAHGGGLA